MENNSGHHCPLKVTVTTIPEEHRHLLSDKPLRSADRDEIARLTARIARLQAEVRAWRGGMDCYKDIRISLYDGNGKQRTLGETISYKSVEPHRAAVDQHKDLEPPCQQ